MEQGQICTNMRMPWALSRSLLLVEFTNIPSLSRKLLWLENLLCRIPILLFQPMPYVSLQRRKQTHSFSFNSARNGTDIKNQGHCASVCKTHFTYHMTHRWLFSLIVLTPWRSERGVLGRFRAIPMAADQWEYQLSVLHKKSLNKRKRWGEKTKQQRRFNMVHAGNKKKRIGKDEPWLVKWYIYWTCSFK